ncbi:hypothetical protein [Clostridium thermarum]|uniref:hypothetical protein n=1 Tax=Clostridium thermarum TaxID=1716543 RepID=UPI0013D1BD5A|nr:hypothetical protein [Clostridium thermarum]
MGFFNRSRQKELKENEARLRRTNNFEVRYVTTRDGITYGESIIGKYGIIEIVDDIYRIICDNKIVFEHPIKGLMGSELMSLDGIILSYIDHKTGENVEVIAYYKYHRK